MVIRKLTRAEKEAPPAKTSVAWSLLRQPDLRAGIFFSVALR
jgi:hypothetical protein